MSLRNRKLIFKVTYFVLSQTNFTNIDCLNSVIFLNVKIICYIPHYILASVAVFVIYVVNR